MDMMDAVANVLAGKLRYQLWRNASDRCYYSSSDSLVGLQPHLTFAIDDGCDGYVLDTKTQQRKSLSEANEICRKLIADQLYFSWNVEKP